MLYNLLKLVYYKNIRLLLDTKHNHKPVKLQNGVGPTHCFVSASYKCSERQYSDVLSVYAIRTNDSEEQKEMCYIKFIAQTLIWYSWAFRHARHRIKWMGQSSSTCDPERTSSGNYNTQ